MFSRKTIFIAALALFVPLASLTGGILLGQVANEGIRVYPSSNSAESPGDRLLTPASETMSAPQPLTYESPTGLTPANGSQIAKMPPWSTSVGPAHAAATSRSNPMRAASQYAPRPLEPMTGVEIDEALAGPLPGESHDKWLAKIERADKWMADQTKRLVAQYRAAETDEQRAELKAKIKELSEKHFDIRHKSRDLEVLKLEERLREIRAAIAKRNESKDLIVQVRLSVLLGEIEWDDWALPRKSADRLIGYSSVGSNPHDAAASASAYMPAPITPRSGPPFRGSSTHADLYPVTNPPGVLNPGPPFRGSSTHADLYPVTNPPSVQIPGPVVPTASTNAAVPPSPLSDPAAVGAPPEEASSDGASDSEPAETGAGRR